MNQPAENLANPVAQHVGSNALKRSFDFYSLPRPIQDRFLASANGRGVPEVLLFAPAARRSGWLGLAIALVGLSGLAFLVFAGFGNLKHSGAIQETWFVFPYAALAGLVGLGLSLHTCIRARHERYPFRLGTYLFPAGVIIARNERLKFVPITELSEVSVSAGRLLVKFSKRKFAFPLRKGANADAIKPQLEGYRVRFCDALATYNRKELAALDPIRDSGFSNPLSSKDPIAKSKDTTYALLAFGLGVGLLLGTGVFFVRDRMATRSLYAAVREADTVEAYSDYRIRGGDRPEVTDLLLPRAELKQAVGSLVAVERYAERNPNSKIVGEIGLALRAELLSALEEVRAAGTLRAIEKFQLAHPRHESIAPELAEARSAVFKNALKEFSSSSAAPPATNDFIARALRFSEKHGPTVEVRFRRFVPKSAVRADSSIRRSAYFTGAAALPSQYLAAEHAAPRERAAAEGLIAALQPLWSPELLALAIGKGLDGEGKLPDVKVPTLWISYATEMSGGYTTQRPRGVYVGLGMMMRADFVMPTTGPAVSLKDSSWLPPDVNEIWRDNLRPAEVYDRNARLGFERFVAKFLQDKFAITWAPKGKSEQP